ncbi:transporter, major facilitator family [Luminiphilus syltensis NOR5-1B]|uniref:Transporter, major facilitator family n=1 Tax=Luminiphilus syltensis NOR5-1B TaxID=565045 RepID=B8KV90_9GAMM|nr:MFS transporter [Luminiphilus syltensis]EED35207.1 transporter, major facilitator family [Luminiphilus syltensis NOR5-1B]
MTAVRVLILGVVAGLSSFGVDFYLPATKALALSFDSEVSAAGLNVSLFFLGIAVGQFIGGALSDAFGRKKLLVVALLVFIVASISQIFSSTLGLFIALRSIQGVAGGALAVVVTAIICDENDVRGTAKLLSQTTVISIGMRFIAPMLAGYLVAFVDWHALPAIVSILSIACLIFVLFHIDETLPAAKRRRRSLVHSLQDIWMILCNSRTRIFIAIEMCCSVGLFAFVTGSAHHFIENYLLSSTEFGYVYSGFTVVLLVAVFSNQWLVTKFGIALMMRSSIPVQLFFASALIFTARFFEPVLWLHITLLAGYLASAFIIRLNATAAAVKSIPEVQGTAASIISTISFGVGGLIGVQMTLLSGVTTYALEYLIFASSVFLFLYFLLCLRSRAFNQ